MVVEINSVQSPFQKENFVNSSPGLHKSRYQSFMALSLLFRGYKMEHWANSGLEAYRDFFS